MQCALAIHPRLWANEHMSRIPVFARLSGWFGPYRLPSGLVVKLMRTGYESGVPVVHLPSETGDEITVLRSWFNKVAKAA